MTLSNLSTPATLAIALAAVFPHAAEARPMTPEDLATFDRVGAPVVSPNERWAAFSVTETEADSYERSSALYLLDLSNAKAAPMRVADRDGASEHSPSFGADGSLYYLSDASEQEELWRIAIGPDGARGRGRQVSELDGDIAGYQLSPRGDRVAVWGDMKTSCVTFGCDAETPTDAHVATGREYTTDDGFVRHWDSWETPGSHSRLFVYPVTAKGPGVAIAPDLKGDAPTKPFGGGEEIAWAPDGSALYFTLRKSDANEPSSTNLDIYRADAASGAAENLTQANEATDTLFAPSPDGRWLAYAAMERPGYESDRLVVQLRDLSTGATRALTDDWDRSVGSIAWTPDSRRLIVTTQDTLDHPAFEIEVATGKRRRLTGTGNVANVVPLRTGGIVYTLNSLNAPTDIYRTAPASAAVRLTNMNGDRSVDDVSVKRFSFAGADGDTVWGQIIKPASAATTSATGTLPMAFLVHGGPQGSFGDGWSTRWNPKVIASQGYAVVTIDFHGSTGYGQAFTDSINRDWGGKPLTDLKLGFDAALREDPAIDGERACALGASYGGYMMNWIAGNWPDRFNCIVNHAGLFDLRSFSLSTEELWFDQWDHGGNWWERDQPERWNPLNHAPKWQTPMLVIHGEKDFRIPYTQSLMAFTAAKEFDVPAKLLIFPDENHWILKGANSVQWHRNVFDWMARWTRPTAN